MIGREKPGEQSEVAQLIQQTLEQERWQREMMEQRYNQYMDEQEVRAHFHTLLKRGVQRELTKLLGLSSLISYSSVVVSLIFKEDHFSFRN